MAYGVKTRQLNMTRGNREGNNAFLKDEVVVNWQHYLRKVIYEECKDPKIVDYVNAAVTNPLKNKRDFNQIFDLQFEHHLHDAIRAGNRVIAHHVLGRMINSKTQSNFGYNQLHFTVLDSKDDKFEVSHRSSLDKKTIGNAVITPVHIACINPNEKVLKKLIDLGADWHFLDNLNRKPIHYAAACEGSGPLKLLLSIGAHVDEPDRMKVTPIVIAAQYGRLDNVKMLVKAKAKLNGKTKLGNTALHEAAAKGYSEILRLLVEEGEMKVDMPGKDRMTPLMMAAMHGHKNCVETLLELRAKVLKKDKFKRSALLLACRSGQTVIASILLRHGSDFNMPDSSSNTPLHYACAYGWISIVELLLKAGANVNLTNMWKISPLEVAMLKNHFGVVKFLLNNSSVDVNMKFDKGNTLLHHSFVGITKKSIAEIEYLINEKKADVNIQNMDGLATIHLLAQYNYNQYSLVNPLNLNTQHRRYNAFKNKEDDDEYVEENKDKIGKHKEEHKLLIKNIFSILIKSNAFINIRSTKDKTAFQIALETKNFPFIEEMINLSPDLLFVDDLGQTVLHLLSDYLFDKQGEDVMLKIVDKLFATEGVDKIANSLDDKGFTPILKLFYNYSNNVKGFYDKIVRKETFALKSKIYEESLNLKEGSAKKPDKINEDEEDIDYDHILGKVPIMKKSKSGWTNLNSMAIKYGIQNNENQSKFQKISSISISLEDYKVVLEKSRGLFFEYISAIFEMLVTSYIKFGCNIHAQIQKTKKWRDWKPGNPYPEEEPAEGNNQNDIVFSIPYHFGGQPKAIHHLSSMRTQRTLHARRGGIKQPVENKKSKKDHDEANEYIKDLGLSNVLMLLMAFPMANIVENLIESLKVDVNILDIYKQNVLLYLIKNYDNIQHIFPEAFDIGMNILLKNNVKVNQFDRDSNSSFLLMSKYWDIKEMEKLYNVGADVNQINKKGENALIYYIRQKDKFRVNALLNSFMININHRDERKRTAIHYLYNDEDSSADIDMSLKQILLSRNPDVNAQDICGRTPLHYLFVKIGKEFENSEIDPIVSLSTLLDIKGINVDVQDIYGNTPLHYASQRGATISAMALIQKSDINKKNFEGNTPLAYSLLFQQPNFAIVLIQKGANIYDSGFLFKERSEDALVKKLQKKEKRISSTQKTSSEEDIVALALYTVDGMESKVQTSMIMDQDIDESDQDSNDDSDSQSEEDDNFNNNNSTSIFYGDSKMVRQVYAKQAKVNNMYNMYNPHMNESCQQNNNANLNFKDMNKKYFTHQEDKEKGISLFRICVKNGYQGLTYLFVNNGYDLMKAIQDSFYENKFNLAMLLIDKSPYDEIYRSCNEKGQNLFHILALFGKSVKNKNEYNIFFEKMSEKGIPLNQQDKFGYTPIHYACEHHFKELVEYILTKVEPKNILSYQTNSGFTPFICAIKGNNFIHSMLYIEMLISHIGKSQLSLPYLEEKYAPGYKCTPLIHLTRSYLESSHAQSDEPILSNEGKTIIKLIEFGASVMEQDSLGMDCLMHCVKENNLKLLDLFVKNCQKQISYSALDRQGKSLVHYAVCPMDEGSYENENLLIYLLENKFVANIKDVNGKTPFDYASEQQTGVNLRILKRFNICPQDSVVVRRKNSMISLSEWKENRFNYEIDADSLYQSMASVVGKREEIIILPDKNGAFPEDTHSLLRDEANGYWDITMTKVKVGGGLYGEYNFYKMQLIHDKGRDIYILWNRFGRIGEVGQSQRTPFNSIEEAQTEFKKIFKEKSGNEWENKSNFQRAKGKYMLLKFNESKLSHKDLLEAFDYKKCPDTLVKEKAVRNLIKELTNSAIYFKALNESGIDTDLLNFNYLNKELIMNARSILGEINKIQNEISDLRTQRNLMGLIDDNIVDKVLELKSQIYDLSSRYYELIPKAHFKESPVRALDNETQLKEEISLLENLTYVEGAVKILLGAQFRQREINPIDYCLEALNIQIETLKQNGNEFGLLKKYITQNSEMKVDSVLNIFRIQRKGEADNIQKWNTVPNHMLLFHGSKVFNFIGILSSGLKIAPPEAPATGYMFGKGVYFADMFDKSYNYCDYWDVEDEKGRKKSHKYMLICEVALGNMFEVSRDNEFDRELGFLKRGFDSLKALSSQGPDPALKFVMNNGVEIPLGKTISYNHGEKKDKCVTNSPEYVVYDSSQIRMRYLIQLENDSNLNY